MTPLKSLLDLWSSVAYTFPETKTLTVTRLQNLVTSRGLMALTQLLPEMGKSLDRAISCGHHHLLSNIKHKKGYNTPLLLHEFYTLIFDKDGDLRDCIDPTVIRRLRTLLYMFYKYEVPFTEQQLTDAKVKFKCVDQSVKTDFSASDISSIKTTFNSLLPPNPLDIRGRHSNGATADGLDVIDRENTYRYIPTLSRVYNPWYFFNSRLSFKEYVSNNAVEKVEPSSRVAFVPKDSRGPRTICMEPHERMFIQQGLMMKIYEHIENYSTARGRINFSDQTINQRLAQFSSLDGKYATLDLKDASDLVSWSLIEQLVDDEWRAALTATRSSSARLDDETILLRKYAPMGSALCFPIEAILFYSICSLITPDVYVYGDDIIVPVHCASQCMDMLEHYGLLINRDKSFLYGDFKESCGMDAFRGAPISPVRYRRDDYASVIAFANNISEAFGECAGLSVITWYESINHVIIPRARSRESDIGHLVFYGRFSNLVLFKRRYNRSLHRYEYRILTADSVNKRSNDSDDGAYNIWFSKTMTLNSPSEDSRYTCSDTRVAFERDVNLRTKLNKPGLKWKWVPYIN